MILFAFAIHKDYIQVILPSVRGSQRLQGEKLKPVVLTPRSVAAPQVLNRF